MTFDPETPESLAQTWTAYCPHYAHDGHHSYGNATAGDNPPDANCHVLMTESPPPEAQGTSIFPWNEVPPALAPPHTNLQTRLS